MFLLTPSTLGWDLAILCLLVGPAAVATLCLCSPSPRSRWTGWLRRPLALLASLTVATVAYGSFVEPWLLIRTRVSVPLATREPLTIALIADLHVGPYKDADWVRRVVATTNAQLPDLVLLAGDFLADETSDLQALAPLADLRAPLGVFAVTGNHDIGLSRSLSETQRDRTNELAAALTAFKVRTLRNEHVLLRHQGDDVALVGIDDLWSQTSNLDAAFATLPPGTPTLLLAHQPDILLDTLSQQADVILTGHTHGGQIRLPWLGALPGTIPSRLDQFDQGSFEIDEDTTLVVTRGAGESGPRARLFAWPEVMVVRTERR